MKITHRGRAITSIAPAVNALPVIEARGMICRGKLTLVTRLALETRLDAPICAPPKKNVHTVSPTNRNSA